MDQFVRHSLFRSISQGKRKLHAIHELQSNLQSGTFAYAGVKYRIGEVEEILCDTYRIRIETVWDHVNWFRKILGTRKLFRYTIYEYVFNTTRTAQTNKQCSC